MSSKNKVELPPIQGATPSPKAISIKQNEIAHGTLSSKKALFPSTPLVKSARATKVASVKTVIPKVEKSTSQKIIQSAFPGSANELASRRTFYLKMGSVFIVLVVSAIIVFFATADLRIKGEMENQLIQIFSSQPLIAPKNAQVAW